MTDTQAKASRSKSNAAFNMGSLELEGKIADLERKLTQRDETIDKMKSEMEAAQKVSITKPFFLFIVTNLHMYIILYNFYVLMQLTNISVL